MLQKLFSKIAQSFLKSNRGSARLLLIDSQSIKALAHSVKAGISPKDALQYIAKSVFGQKRKDVLRIAEMFSLGNSYSSIFEKTVLNRKPMFIQIMQISESNGQIADALDKIVAHSEHIKTIRSQIIGLSVYPIIISVITFAFLIFALYIIVPNIKDIISMPGIELNLISKSLLYMSDGLKENLMGILGGIAGFVLSLFLVAKIRRLRSYLELLLLKLPIVSMVIFTYLFGSCAAFLALYTKFKSDIGSAFMMLTRMTKLSLVKSNFQYISETVGKGRRLSDVLTETQYIPKIWILFSSVAERSSSYSDMFTYLSEYHSEALAYQTKIFMKILEPVLMVGIGVMVGLLAYGILSPLYGLMQGLK